MITPGCLIYGGVTMSDDDSGSIIFRLIIFAVSIGAIIVYRCNSGDDMSGALEIINHLIG